MFYDTFGPYTNIEDVHSGSTSRITIVSAVAIPLSKDDDDFLIIEYEGCTYQGLMGDNAQLVNRVTNLKNAIIPNATSKSIRYEEISDLFVTTAGSGIPYLDHRHIAANGFYSPVLFGTLPDARGAGAGGGGGGDFHFRGSYYDPEFANKHGLSIQYKKRIINSERLRIKSLGHSPPGGITQTYKGAFYDAPDDDFYDSVMHFVPGPPTQFFTQTLFNAFGFATGPGQIYDYDHASLTGSFQTDDNFIGIPIINQLAKPDGPSTTIKVPHRAGQIPFKLVSFDGGTNLLEPDAIDVVGNFIVGQSFNGPGAISYGSVIHPIKGTEIVRVVSDSTLTQMINRTVLGSLALADLTGQPVGSGLLPEHIGHRNTPFSTSTYHFARGTQGINTARQTVISRPTNTLISTFHESIGLLPVETVFQPTIIDKAFKSDDISTANPRHSPVEFISNSELIPPSISYSSIPISYQNQGNTSFENQCLFYGFPINPFYPIIFGQTHATQRMWAFKGSVINNAGRLWLLVNAGFGSALVRDWHLPGFRFDGVYPHTGYSADAFHLLYRPVKRKDTP
jgi:hypothetical protein